MAIEVRNIRPKTGSGNIPIQTNIEFDLVSTDGDLIDISTLIITVESKSVITEDILTTTYTVSDSSSIQYQGDSNYYKIFLNPDKPFEQGMEVVIKIDVDSTASASMTQYSITFNTVYNDLISDFQYTVMYQAQNIPVYNEILLGNSSGESSVFSSAYRNWNFKPRVEIKVNQVIVDSGFTIDYNNGKVIFDDVLEYNDQVEASYTFRFISDEQIQNYFRMAAAEWRTYVPVGGPSDIYNADMTMRYILFFGAAQFAFNDLISSLAYQEKRIIFDNRSWDEAWKTMVSLFEGQRNFYKEKWDKLLEQKKLKLPSIASIVTPEFSLPGSRSRFFRYMFKANTQ